MPTQIEIRSSSSYRQSSDNFFVGTSKKQVKWKITILGGQAISLHHNDIEASLVMLPGTSSRKEENEDEETE